MRKHVTPVDPAATIFDPERGRALPPAGLTVSWTAYWAGLALRKEITAEDLPDKLPAEGDDPAPAADEAAAPAEPPTAAPTSKAR